MISSGKVPKANLSTTDPSKRLVSDSSSLVDLKAEVIRKRQEASFNKLHGVKAPLTSSIKSKGSNIWSAKNAGIQNRQAEDIREEEENQQKVREALQKKSHLYEQLKSKQITDNNSERFLVNFNESNRNESDSDSDDPGPGNYPAENSDEEWVEFTDALGRTRTCMKKDLRHLKSQNRELKEIKASKEQAEEVEKAEQLDLMSEDMRREMLRKKWEQEEEENLQKRNVHYQDVLFDEARAHGAGFYKFARDEVTRASQQEELSKLHAETKEARVNAEKAKAKKKEAMRIRLKKVRDKKRKKMGLPVLPSYDDPDEIGKDIEDETSKDNDEEQNIEMSIMETLKSMREQNEEMERERQRKLKVREWDKGKEGLEEMLKKMGEKKKVLSQQEWVQEKRLERQKEFAPPTNYDNTTKSKGIKGKKRIVPGPISTTQNPSPHGGANLPDFSKPPPGYPQVIQPQPNANLQRMKGLDESTESSSESIGPQPKERDSDMQTTSDSNISLGDRLKMYRNAVDPDTSTSFSRRGTEIPPPCSMDYFANPNTKSKPMSGFQSKTAMKESFNFGLGQSKRLKRGNESSDDDDSE